MSSGCGRLTPFWQSNSLTLIVAASAPGPAKGCMKGIRKCKVRKKMRGCLFEDQIKDTVTFLEQNKCGSWRTLTLCFCQITDSLSFSRVTDQKTITRRQIEKSGSTNHHFNERKGKKREKTNTEVHRREWIFQRHRWWWSFRISCFFYLKRHVFFC